MVSYKHNAPTSLDTLLIQNTLVSLCHYSGLRYMKITTIVVKYKNNANDSTNDCDQLVVRIR